jgi:hypothetical protein
MVAKTTVKDPNPGPYPGKVVSRGVLRNTPNNVTRALPGTDAGRVRNSGSPVGPEHPRTTPKGTGTKSPL